MLPSKQLIYQELTYKIRKGLFNVFNSLGFGHKENIYQKAIEIEFTKLNIPFKSEAELKVSYDGSVIGNYRADFLIDDKIVLEIKALDFLPKSSETQLVNYLKSTGYKLGIIVNFGSPRLYIKRLIWTDLNPRKSKINQRTSLA